MNRLQKKCFVASTGLHLLLAVLLIVGPAFVAPNSRIENVTVLEFVPMITTDDNTQGGGRPDGRLPQVSQTPPRPALPAPPVPADPQPAPAVQPPKTEPEPRPSFEVTNTRKSPKVSLTRKKNPNTTSKTKANADARVADARRTAAANALGQAIAGIDNGLAPATTVGDFRGPGGGGLPYGNWQAAVHKVYRDAWIPPDGIADDSVTTSASVTIARDGTVLESRITHRSGNDVFDQAVQMTLDRVRRTHPFPDTAKEDKRTVTIYFDLKTKLLG